MCVAVVCLQSVYSHPGWTQAYGTVLYAGLLEFFFHLIEREHSSDVAGAVSMSHQRSWRKFAAG